MFGCVLHLVTWRFGCISLSWDGNVVVLGWAGDLVFLEIWLSWSI